MIIVQALNECTIVDRSKIKPKNYADLIEQTNELKSEILHVLKCTIQDGREDEIDKKVQKREMEIQTMVGFSRDLPYAFCAIKNT